MRRDEDRLARHGEVTERGRGEGEGDAEGERDRLAAAAGEAARQRQRDREARAPEKRVGAVEGEEPDRGPREGPVAPPSGPQSP